MNLKPKSFCQINLSFRTIVDKLFFKQGRKKKKSGEERRQDDGQPHPNPYANSLENIWD